ncbi:major type 1 subunit fimbrin (pilin) [Pseudomonas sp. GV071]|jgi:major type 1 subunit fimbrin (pilin)|nr:major type 1 subunit fimbrin (pilin) [Pseudomonas sp. GV071]
MQLPVRLPPLSTTKLVTSNTYTPANCLAGLLEGGKMKRLSALLFSLLMVDQSFSAEGTKFFAEGVIRDVPCAVDPSGATVKLPFQRKSSLAKPNDVAGRTPFRLTVKGCATAQEKDVYIYFNSEPSDVNRNGRLDNTASGGAKFVELQLLNAKGEVIDLNGEKGAQNAGPAKPGTTTGANFDFFVEYFATGQSTIGPVRSTLTFMVETF